MKAVAILTSLFLANAAVAGEACDNPKNNFDGLYCLNKIYQQADKELNDNYKILVPLLDSAGRATLRQGQLAWQSERNNMCSRDEGTRFLVDLQCATDTTIKRSQFLQDRIRECKSSGCLNSRL